MTSRLNSSSQGGSEEEQIATLERTSDLLGRLFTQWLGHIPQRVQGEAREFMFLTISPAVMLVLLVLVLILRIAG